MPSNGIEKKRKAIALPTEAPQKKSKKATKLLDTKTAPAEPVHSSEAEGISGVDIVTKSKPKARKRAADFLSDNEDNAANGARKNLTEATVEVVSKPKKKKSKKEDSVVEQVPAIAEEAVTAIAPTTAKGSKKDKTESKTVASSTNVLVSEKPSSKVTSKKRGAVTSDNGADRANKISGTPAEHRALKKSMKNKKSQGVQAETLTADGTNGVAELNGDENLDPIGSRDANSTSMQAEAQATTEKELEDEWGTDDDDEDDQGAQLLAGFDSDGEDNGEDEGLVAGSTMPVVPIKASKQIEKASQKGGNVGRGTVYVGRIPHGFYEKEMKEYFSQFGNITQLRLSRNRRTGESKHFAFVEFESDDVAQIVAKTMDNYLMFGHILKCKYAPQDSLHPSVWKGANKRFKKVPHVKLEKQALETPKSKEVWSKKTAKEQRKREQKNEKMKSLGYQIDLPQMKQPEEVLEQRKLHSAEQESLLEAPKEVADAPTGALEPPNGLPKDEVALKVEEKKSKKKDKKAKKEPMKATAEVVAPAIKEIHNEPTETTTGALEPRNGLPKDEGALKVEEKIPRKRKRKAKEQAAATIPEPAVAPEAVLVEDTGSVSAKAQPESEKRDKRKEKKNKSKTAKNDQSQLDSQLTAAAEPVTTVGEAANSTALTATKSITNGDDDHAAVVANPDEEQKKRKRKQKKKTTPAATGTEASATTPIALTTPVVVPSTKTTEPAKKEKAKKRKSDGDQVELKSILKKSKKA